MTDTSQYYKPPGSDTTYTSYDAYKQNIGGATPLAQSANTYSASPSLSQISAVPIINQTQAPAAPVNTSQPNPATVNATPYTSKSFYLPQTPVAGLDPSTVFNDRNEALSKEQFLAQGGKADFSNVTKVSALQQGLAAAKQSGAAPQDAGDARSAVQKLTPPTPPSMANIDAQLAQDPGYQQLQADRLEYNSVANQTKSLVDTYNEAITAAGIPALNTELLNTKNIIDGTEDDIRKEVQSASGFATDSQVLALAGARNKSLIKNYNNLLATKQMAMENINNLVSLSSQDRVFAQQNVLQKLQIDEQINQYRDKFVKNAQEGYDRIINTVGYKGLLDGLKGDAKAIATVEKSLGLHPGGLQALVQTQNQQTNLANLKGVTTPYAINEKGEVQDVKSGQGFSSPEDFQQKTGMTLDQAGAKGLITKVSSPVDLKQYPASYQEYLLTDPTPTPAEYNAYQTMDANRKAVRSTTNINYNQSQDQQQQADISQTNNNLKSVAGSDGFVSPADWKRAYGDWLSAGHKGQDFIDNFSGFINRHDNFADANDYGVKP